MTVAGRDGDWLASLSPRTRREYRRSRRKLEAAGSLDVRLHRCLDDSDLLSRFLALEADGWKGRAGTAIQSTPSEHAFFRAISRNLASRDELFFVEVSVDDQPVSITANLVDGSTVFGFKVAHAPAFANASPGIFNTLEVLRMAHQDAAMTSVDSGSDASPCLLRYWPESRPMATILAATRGVAGAALLSVLPAARQMRHRASRLLRWRRPQPRRATA